MAITRNTLDYVRQLSNTTGREVDQVVRDMARAWLRAWDELLPAWHTVVEDILANLRDGEWPPAHMINRLLSLSAAVTSTSRSLEGLAVQAQTQMSTSAMSIVAAVAAAEPIVIASQYPAAVAAAAAMQTTQQILPTALDAIVARSTGRIVSRTSPLPEEVLEEIRRVLIFGVAVGQNPRKAARLMLRRIKTAFNGGLSRLMVIARTEMLDAHREASRYAHAANEDVLAGWQWICALDRRSCPACWSMHGRVFPLSEPGPLGHPQCRCARVPKVKTWAELGIDLPESDDRVPDAQQRFWSLPKDVQLKIMGPGRLELLRSGTIRWEDLAMRKENPDWRPSYVPTPLYRLKVIAEKRAAN